MGTVCEELLKLLPREELEDTIRRLNSEVAELRDEVKFWRCRAEASSKEQGKVLNRSSISEEMLNELNSLASKMDVLKIVDERANKENKAESGSVKQRQSVQKPPPLPPPPCLPSPSSSSAPTTNEGPKVALNTQLKNIFMKKAPPKMMSRADFIKMSEKKQNGGFKRNASSSEASAQSLMNNSIKKGSSRISLQWGCLAEEYPKFDDKTEEKSFRDYFAELEEKLSVLVKDGMSEEECRLELQSCSIFSRSSEEEGGLQIPSEKLFEWFVKKEGVRSGKVSVINRQQPPPSADSLATGEAKPEGRADMSSSGDRGVSGRMDPRKQPKATGGETRACIFGPKTSRMLQITINYFKKKVPKSQQKSLDFFKRSILQCTLDKEGVNLLLETVPDQFENAAKYEVWKECVRSVEKYLESSSRETLLEEEEFVYFLSRIPNISKRLECMILKSSFEQLYCESLKWIEEKIRGLELILKHRRLPLLFKAVVDSRNALNSRLVKENQQQEPEKVKFIPLSSMKKLQSLKSPNVQGKTLLNFISSVVGEIFTAEEISILKKSSEKNITMVYTMTTDLIFSWLELRDGSESIVFVSEGLSGKGDGEEVPECADEFQEIMKHFYSDKYEQMTKLCSKFRKMLRLYVASCYYFGDISTFIPLAAKTNQGKLDLIETLLEFINKYNEALKQEMAGDSENISPKSMEETPISNLKKPLASSITKARRLSQINDMKNILTNPGGSKPRELLTQCLSGDLAKPKTNIQQLFAKSIVKELNLKPLFNRGGAEPRGDRHVSFSDGSSAPINSGGPGSSTGTLGMAPSTEDFSVSMPTDGGKTTDSSFMEDIEQTVALPIESFLDRSQGCGDGGTGTRHTADGKQLSERRPSVLELSEQAREILSRNNKEASFGSSSSSSSSFDDGDDDDNETVALSPPSYTRLMDINSMLESGTAENGDSSSSVSEAALEKDHGLRKKVVIMAEDYESPVKENTRFNRRQSIRRICQIATYLENNGCSDDLDETSEGFYPTDAFSRYRSPMVPLKKGGKEEEVDGPSCPDFVGTRSSQGKETSDHYYFDPDLDGENSKTQVLNDMLEIDNPLDEQPNTDKENCFNTLHGLYNPPQPSNTDSKALSEYSPQKIIFTRKSGRLGGTLSPPYD